MSDALEKLRAALRAAEAETPQVVVPVDDEDMRCMRCGGSGKVDGFVATDIGLGTALVDCPDCGGCGMKREGVRAPRTPLSKKASEARVDKAWWGAKGMRVTLLSDRPPGSTINMSAVDEDTKLTGPGLITDKFERDVETSIRFSKRMFVRPGGVIAFVAIHDAEGAVAAVFPVDNVIHDGDEYRLRFKLVEDTFRIKTVSTKHVDEIVADDPSEPGTGTAWDLLDATEPGWFASKMKAKAEEARSRPKLGPRKCVDCGKKLLFRTRTSSASISARCFVCNSKHAAIVVEPKLEED